MSGETAGSWPNRKGRHPFLLSQKQSCWRTRNRSGARALVAVAAYSECTGEAHVRQRRLHNLAANGRRCGPAYKEIPAAEAGSGVAQFVQIFPFLHRVITHQRALLMGDDSTAQPIDGPH
jgi:hypothetical protein